MAIANRGGCRTEGFEIGVMVVYVVVASSNFVNRPEGFALGGNEVATRATPTLGTGFNEET